MSQPFIGEISAFGFGFAPTGWAQCNGQILPIAQYSALFALLGTTFGGNGTTNFGLPNLQCSAPMHWGAGPGGFNTALGEPTGEVAVALLQTEIPLHNHAVNVANEPSGYPAALQTAGPVANAYLSQTTGGSVYVTPSTPNTMFNPQTIGVSGQSVPHENRQPFLAINFCIAMEGSWPSRN